MTLTVTQRLDGPADDTIRQSLNTRGWAEIPSFLSADECRDLRQCWDRTGLFRTEVDMQRHNFGRGRYRYFAYPLPETVAEIRTALYRSLVPLANDWMQKLRHDISYPADLAAFLQSCHDQGQQRPTPLMLEYGQGDFNRLHQDQYGPLSFPLQAVILLSDRRDFDGGQFILTETRPRTQTRAHVVDPAQGSIIIFAGSRRPVPGIRGHTAVALRHGVSEIFRGRRQTLGIIFHDAA